MWSKNILFLSSWLIVNSLLLPYTIAHASTFHNHESITNAIVAFTGPHTEVSKIDPRLKLDKCNSPLEISYPFSTKTTIAVNCPDPGKWKIFVRVQNPKSEISYQSHEDIYRAIRNFVNEDIVISEINSKLIFKKCGSPISITFPFTSKNTIKASCLEKNGWNVFVSISYKSEVNEKQNHSDIYNAIRHFVNDEKVQISPISSKLDLNRCEGDLEISYPFDSQNTVKVRCPFKNNWEIFVSIGQLVQRKDEQPHDEIYEAIRQFAGNVEITEISPLRFLEKCSDKLLLSFPYPTKSTVQVSCNSGNTWKIYVAISKKELFEAQSHDEIYKAILNFAGKVKIRELSPNKSLQKCPESLHVEYPYPNRNTVLVSCESNVQWKILLPVTHENNISKETIKTPVQNLNESKVTQLEGVVAKRPLSRGTVIKEEDVEIQLYPSNILKDGHLKQIDDILGYETNQTIPKGTLISQNMLRPIILVRTGQIVTIYYDRKGFSIKNEGKALENGGLREKIKVKLPNSGNTITAIVQAPGIVKIP